MKLTFLIQYQGKDFDEISENIDVLLHHGDSVYIIANEQSIRDDLMLAYADESRMNVVYEQDGALPADLSMPRGYLISLKEAFEKEDDADYFITLSDGMIPLVKREVLVDYLQKYPTDIYHVLAKSSESKDLQRRLEHYAFFTNSYSFQTSKIIQAMERFTTRFVHLWKKRTFQDEVIQTLPWFILTRQSAQILVDHFSYCAQTFKMCAYPEELVIGTMLHHFSPVKHHDDNIWACDYVSQQAVPALKNIKKGYLFGAKINPRDNLAIYSSTFDTYCQD